MASCLAVNASDAGLCRFVTLEEGRAQGRDCNFGRAGAWVQHMALLQVISAPHSTCLHQAPAGSNLRSTFFSLPTIPLLSSLPHYPLESQHRTVLAPSSRRLKACLLPFFSLPAAPLLSLGSSLPYYLYLIIADFNLHTLSHDVT